MSTPSTTPMMLLCALVVVGLEVDSVESAVLDVAAEDGHFTGYRGDAVTRRSLDVQVVDDHALRRLVRRTRNRLDAIAAGIPCCRVVEGDIRAAVDLDPCSHWSGFSSPPFQT